MACITTYPPKLPRVVSGKLRSAMLSTNGRWRRRSFLDSTETWQRCALTTVLAVPTVLPFKFLYLLLFSNFILH
jgi:hypothetical protein